MTLLPLALVPVVTVARGQARLAPAAYGSSDRDGAATQAVASWAGAGVGWVHVVDEDGSYASAAGAPVHVQLSGGIGDDAALGRALATGASRVVVEGEPDWVAAVVAAHGDDVAVGLDIRQPDVFDLGLALEEAGARRFVVSDHRHEHHWRLGDRHLLREFCEARRVPVMAFGSISHLNDLHELHELVPLGLDGIIIGDALYDGEFTFQEAVAAGADRFDMFFWGPPNL